MDILLSSFSNIIKNNDLKNTKLKDIVFNQYERSIIIYIYTFIKQDFVSINHYRAIFLISKNTILNDIKTLNLMLKDYNLKLIYSKKDGYYINGSNLKKRKFLEKSLNLLENKETQSYIVDNLLKEWNVDFRQKREEIRNYLLTNENFYVKNKAENIINLFLCISLQIDNKNIKYSKKQKDELEKLGLDEVAKNIEIILFNEPLNNEKYYILANLVEIINFNEFSFNHKKLKNITSLIVDNMKERYGIKHKNIDEFKYNLYIHIIPSYYRMLFDIEIKNELIEDIYRDYSFLFDISKEFLKPLSNYLEKDINENELGFYALHFGSEILNDDYTLRKKEFKVYVTCPDGISGSIILKNQLEQMFPSVIFKHISLSKINTENDIDLIFTTKEEKTNEKMYYLPPILTSKDKYNLIKFMKEKFNIESKMNVNIDDVVQDILKNMNLNLKNSEKLKEILIDSIYKDNKVEHKLNELSLKDIIKFEYIGLDIDISNINDAIKESGYLLLNKNIIKYEYIENVIRKITEYPVSCYLRKNFYIPHTFDVNNVNEVGISLLRLKNEIYLEKDKPIKIIFFLATNDNYKHLNALNELLNILNDEKSRDILLKGNLNKILTLIN